MRDEEIEAAVGPVPLTGRFSVPEHPAGIVVVVRSGGRDRYLGGVLQQAGLATLLIDLRTADDESEPVDVLGIGLLAARLSAVVAWLRDQPGCRDLPLGLAAAGTAAAAALWTAAARADVAAVVSRGGRPDLAGPWLERVQAPTLLLVGGRGDVLLQRTEASAARLRCEHRVVRVSGATHLFAEPGTLELAAQLARDWFADHLGHLRETASPPGVGSAATAATSSSRPARMPSARVQTSVAES